MQFWLVVIAELLTSVDVDELTGLGWTVSGMSDMNHKSPGKSIDRYLEEPIIDVSFAASVQH